MFEGILNVTLEDDLAELITTGDLQQITLFEFAQAEGSYASIVVEGLETTCSYEYYAEVL